MKLLVVLSRFPYPLEKGDKLRAYHQIKELSKLHDIYLVCLTDKNVNATQQNELAQFCQEIHVFKLKSVLMYWNTAKQIFTDKPFQVGYFYQFGIQKKINQLVEKIKPDHIYCQLIRCSEYVKNFHQYKKTIDYMDALSMGMQRRASISSGIRKKLFEIESRRLSEYENRIFDYFNKHTIISEQDKRFINHSLQNKIAIIENGISESFFEAKKPLPKPYEILFTGNMNYAPNIECAEFIVHKILPLLLTDYPKIKVLLSGANPNTRIKALANEHVTVTGWVEDIRESYLQGKIFVAPLFIGTGLQNKLLEAMAMEIPCITTPLANNALQAIANEMVLIANTEKEFAEKIAAILNDTLQTFAMTKRAKEFIQENFSWEKSVKKLSDLLQS